MTPGQATAAIIDALEAGDVPYMLVGSLASNFYGVPRATQDADFVVQVESGRIPAIIDRLGSSFQLERQMSFELVAATTRWFVLLAGTSFSFDLFLLSDDPHDRERFRRRRRVQILGRQAAIPTVEDMIVTKLRWSRQGQRPKDLDDVRNMIAVQGERIDWDYVTAWCTQHGTQEILDNLRRNAAG
jgi:hypothetical protein